MTRANDRSFRNYDPDLKVHNLKYHPLRWLFGYDMIHERSAAYMHLFYHVSHSHLCMCMHVFFLKVYCKYSSKQHYMIRTFRVTFYIEEMFILVVVSIRHKIFWRKITLWISDERNIYITGNRSYSWFIALWHCVQ